MRDPMQLEFPFTNNGALLAYNTAQREHLNRLYNEHFMSTKNSHYIKSRDEFIQDYVKNGGAKAFAEVMSEHYFQHAVERQNDAVWDKWIDNKLYPADHPIYKRLDDVLNERDIEKPVTRICRNGRQVWLQYH